MAHDAGAPMGLTEGVVEDWDALIVAGGKGERLGGVSKPDLRVGEMALLDRTLATLADAVQTVVVGGPARDGVLWTVEDPPGGGPAAAVGAGLAALSGAGGALWTVVVAVDLPGLDAALSLLLRARARDGACLLDASGRAQVLLAVYRTEALAARCGQDMTGWSMRRLVEGLDIVEVTGAHEAAHDVDTWEDVDFWKGRLT